MKVSKALLRGRAQVRPANEKDTKFHKNNLKKRKEHLLD